MLFPAYTQLRIRTSGGRYTQDYIQTLIKLSQKNIELVYPGHDDPIDHDVQSIILETLKNVRNSEVV